MSIAEGKQHVLAGAMDEIKMCIRDRASALLNIPSRRIETEFDTFLSNSFGFGGTNSSLIIRKFKENN